MENAATMQGPDVRFLMYFSGGEAFTKYIPARGWYEIFADELCEKYIGCADTIRDAKEIVSVWATGDHEDDESDDNSEDD